MVKKKTWSSPLLLNFSYNLWYDRWIAKRSIHYGPIRYSKRSSGNWNGEYLVKVEAWNRIVYPIGVQAAVHLGGFSGLNRGLQSSRRVPRGIAVGTRSSFHYVRPLQPEECPAAVVRVASLSVWKQQRPLYVRTIWTIIRSSFFLSLLSYPYFLPLSMNFTRGNEFQRVVRWLKLPYDSFIGSS